MSSQQGAQFLKRQKGHFSFQKMVGRAGIEPATT